MKDVDDYITCYLMVFRYEKSLRLDLEKCDLAARIIKRMGFEPCECSIIVILGREFDKDFSTYRIPALGSKNCKCTFTSST